MAHHRLRQFLHDGSSPPRPHPAAFAASEVLGYGLPGDSPIASSRGGKSFLPAQSRPLHRDFTHLRQLTHPAPDTYDIDPVVSPDGRRIIFERDHPDTVDVVMVDARGRHERIVDLGCVHPRADDLTPSWTADGTRIVFSRVMGPFDPTTGLAQSALLYTATPDGTDVRRLSEPGIDGAYEDYRARFARNGSYLTFVRVRSLDNHLAIFRYQNADRSHVRQLTPWELDADLPDLSLAHSGPTRDVVVFEAPHGPPDGSAVDISTVPTTCTSLEDCTNRIVFVTTNGTGPARSFVLAWSPDGRRIAYVEFLPGDESRPPSGDIWTIRPDGTGRRQVSTSPRFDFRPLPPTTPANVECIHHVIAIGTNHERTRHDHRHRPSPPPAPEVGTCERCSSLRSCCSVPFRIRLHTSATSPGDNGLIAFSASTDTGIQLFTVRPNGGPPPDHPRRR